MIEFSVENTDIVTFPETRFTSELERLLYVNATDVEMAYLNKALAPPRKLSDRRGVVQIVADAVLQLANLYGYPRGERRTKEDINVAVRVLAVSTDAAYSLAQRLYLVLNKQPSIELSVRGQNNGTRVLFLARTPRVFDDVGKEVCNNINVKCSDGPGSDPLGQNSQMFLTIAQLAGIIVAAVVSCLMCGCFYICCRSSYRDKNDPEQNNLKSKNEEQGDSYATVFCNFFTDCCAACAVIFKVMCMCTYLPLCSAPFPDANITRTLSSLL
jgi:hypothetical protein